MLNLFSILVVILLSPGCSFKPSETSKKTLKILFDPTVSSNPSKSVTKYKSATAPTSMASFSCFAANITGAGIASQSMTSGCTSTDNFSGRGLGTFSQAVTRGSSIEVDIPSGLGRTIDIYGFNSTSCPPSGVTNGYLLGSLKTDLLDGGSVRVPITFTEGQTSSLSCNGATSGTTNVSTTYNYFLYAIDSAANKIYWFSIGNSGAITAVSNITTGGTPSNIVASADGRFLLVSNTGAGTYSLYSVNPSNGNLTLLINPALATVTSIALSPNGLFALAGTITHVWPLAFDSTNATLTPGTSSGVGSVSSIHIHPSGEQAYTLHNPNASWVQLNSTTGAVLSNGPLSFGGNQPVSMGSTPDGTYLYGITANSLIYSFSYVSSGVVPAQIGGTLNTGLANPKELVVHPSTNFIYIANQGNNDVVVYESTSGTGAAAYVGAYPATGGETNTMSVALDPRNTYVYGLFVAGTNYIVTYFINADGSLLYSSSYDLSPLLPVTPVRITTLRTQQ